MVLVGKQGWQGAAEVTLTLFCLHTRVWLSCLFGACQSKENHCEATKDKGTYFQGHNLQQTCNKTLPQHAISILLISSKIAEAD